MDLRRLWAVPDFALIERSGQAVTRADTPGKAGLPASSSTGCVDEAPCHKQSHGAAARGPGGRSLMCVWASITVDQKRIYTGKSGPPRPELRRAAAALVSLTGGKASIYRLGAARVFGWVWLIVMSLQQPAGVPDAGRAASTPCNGRSRDQRRPTTVHRDTTRCCGAHHR